MHWLRFLIFNAVGGVLWVLTWTTVGFYLGRHGSGIARIVHSLGSYGIIAAAIAVGIIWLGVVLYRRHQRRAQPGAGRQEH